MPSRTENSGNAAEVRRNPGRKTTKLQVVVRRLNDDHNLRIILPDAKNTPTHLVDEETSRCDQICSRLSQLIAHGEKHLEQALSSLVHELRAESQKWVIIPTPLSGSQDPPRATTSGQQLRFQEILLEHLNRLLPSASPPPQPTQSAQTTRSQSTGIYSRMETPSNPACKRPSDEEISPSEGASKRRRGKDPAAPHLVNPFSALDKVPSRRRGLNDSSSNSSFKTTQENHASGMTSDDQFGDDESEIAKQLQDDIWSHSQRVAVAKKPPTKPVPSTRTEISLSHALKISPSQKRPTGLTESRTESWVNQVHHGARPVAPSPRSAVRASAIPKPQGLPIRPCLSVVSTSSTNYHSLEEAGDEIEVVILDDSPPPAPPTASNVTPRPTKSALAPPPIQTTPVRTPVTPAKTIVTLSPQTPALKNLHKRLHGIWPTFPSWLSPAPLAVAWEMTRIFVHCKIQDLGTLDMRYNPKWAGAGGIEAMWDDLRRYDTEHPDPSLADSKRFHSFPEKPSADAFAAALSGFESRGNVVVMTASLDYVYKLGNPALSGPLYRLDMRPLKLDPGCRLTRRFGPDRFFEILIPSPTAYGAPYAKMEGASDLIIDWITQGQHSLVGREWRAFYTQDSGYKKPTKEYRLGPEPKAVQKDRVHFFAETGHDFRRAPNNNCVFVDVDETVDHRTEFSVSQMLDWLLQVEKNTEQPHLKLFSRIQLGLTKTIPALTFSPDQLIHRDKDIESETGNVMNDGIGLMSPGVARRVRDVLGLSEIPSAIQGRLGSAKGMWIRDVEESDENAIWIETYPSQRKWVCDFGAHTDSSGGDPLQRTLEVKAVSSELKSSRLNLQFLPVLEDRAIDKPAMRATIGKRLTDDLEKEFEAQDNAFSSPIHFKHWLAQNFSTRKRRVDRGHVSMLASLPESKEEIMNMLLDGGFDPRKQKFIRDIAYNLQKAKCEDLQAKMCIKVGRSAYIYMCVDFTGTLKEGEVHLGFSTKFHAEAEDRSYTLLADCDVLVARSPAHFASDVQKVRAVFCPALHSLKDVIIFSSKGNVPLADKLSGGDYDGDLAWVCWDADIVNNFQNAEVPKPPDLSGYLVKDKTTFRELAVRNTLTSQFGSSNHSARDWEALENGIYSMINKSFRFAMLPSYLGICTNFKEKICYQNNSVSNHDAVILSSLVGNLVDQSKQGIIFTEKTWMRMRRDYFGTKPPQDPAYKFDDYNFGNMPDSALHVIDFLKFRIGKPATGRHLKALDQKMRQVVSRAPKPRGAMTSSPPEEIEAHYFDPDLAKLHNDLVKDCEKSMTAKNILESLSSAIDAVFKEWEIHMAGNNKNPDTYSARMSKVYHAYQAITLKSLGCKINPFTAFVLGDPWIGDPDEDSQFALLKASVTFKKFYKKGNFVFNMAGRQLATLKAKASNKGGVGGHLMTVVPSMYAAMNTDQKFIKQYLARNEMGTGWVEDEEMGEGQGGEYEDY